MPEGRFISRSIAVSKQLASVSLEADYLFTRIIPHLDRDGRISGEAAMLKMICVPRRREITEERIPDLLTELARAGLVQWYAVNDEPYLAFPAFRSHQRGMKWDREAKSKIPPYKSENAIDLWHPARRCDDASPTPDHSGTDVAIPPTPQTCATNPARVRLNSGPSPELVPLSEVKLSEVKSRNFTSPLGDGAPPDARLGGAIRPTMSPHAELDAPEITLPPPQVREEIANQWRNLAVIQGGQQP